MRFERGTAYHAVWMDHITDVAAETPELAVVGLVRQVERQWYRIHKESRFQGSFQGMQRFLRYTEPLAI